MNGKERRKLKSIAKVRSVDLKIGKKGLSDAFLQEASRILLKDGMVKFSHSMLREERDDLISSIEKLMSVNLIEKVGKTLTFSKTSS
ncbi:MAG: hypothetical protein CMI24_06825 [Opitutae bacterium]|nr:hypothetical protein [Opitutae bacterium]MEC8420035.1 YhbY family RNA-binding protein [Verrucomicrobiota bacterium]|tara:strand:+ start:37 stop:297 length:261 start_codon:yes stop_codon:yes gene_type:complete